MIRVGQHKRAKYWGGYTVEKVAMLSKPVLVHSQEVDRALFNPTLVKLKWDQDDFHHDFWFPYWITLNDTMEKYGQFAPMMGENTLLQPLVALGCRNSPCWTALLTVSNTPRYDVFDFYCSHRLEVPWNKC